MKSVQFVIALVSLSILAVYVLATDVFATDSLPDETEVEKRLNQWAGAIKKLDVDGMLTFYVDDDKTTMILSSGKQLIGIDRIREIYKQSFVEAEFDSIELQDLTINVHGDFAVATCHLVAETKFKSDGSLWELNCRTSFAFVKNGDKWQILMEHSSELPDVPRLKKREN